MNQQIEIKTKRICTLDVDATTINRFMSLCASRIQDAVNEELKESSENLAKLNAISIVWEETRATDDTVEERVGLFKVTLISQPPLEPLTND